MPKFRVVTHATSDLRLTEKIGEGPAQWDYAVETADGRAHMLIRDIIREGIVAHTGLQIQVELEGRDVEAAAAEAVRNAEVALSLLSAAGRAGTGPARPMLGYDVSPDLVARPFVQWFHDLDIATTKTPVPSDVFGELLEALMGAKHEKLLARLALSVSWHRLGMLETDALSRFMLLWIAVEALSARLADEYEIEDNQGHQSLRRLAAETTGDEDFVSRLLKVRRGLHHRFGETPPATLRAEAEATNPDTERMLIAGWCRLIGKPDLASRFPISSVIPHPTRVVVRGEFEGDGLDARQPGDDPFFSLHLQPRPSIAQADGTVDTTLDVNFTFHDEGGAMARAARYEIWGPAGPNLAKWSEGPVRET
jgi:hypothetical protein